jgi:hypothetical protein
MLSALASIAYREGDLPAALDLIRQSVDAAEAASFHLWEIWQLNNQLLLELELRLLDDVERSGHRVLILNRRLRDRRVNLRTLTGLARAALLRGELQRAGTLWGAVVEDELTDSLVGADDEFAGHAAPLNAELDPAYVAAVETGRTLSLEQATAVALGERQTLP